MIFLYLFQRRREVRKTWRPVVVLMDIADLLFFSFEAILEGLGTRLLSFYQLLGDLRLLGLGILQVLNHPHFYEL